MCVACCGIMQNFCSKSGTTTVLQNIKMSLTKIIEPHRRLNVDKVSFISVTHKYNLDRDVM